MKKTMKRGIGKTSVQHTQKERRKCSRKGWRDHKEWISSETLKALEDRNKKHEANSARFQGIRAIKQQRYSDTEDVKRRVRADKRNGSMDWRMGRTCNTQQRHGDPAQD
jgi:hypothetical protein